MRRMTRRTTLLYGGLWVLLGAEALLYHSAARRGIGQGEAVGLVSGIAAVAAVMSATTLLGPLARLDAPSCNPYEKEEYRLDFYAIAAGSLWALSSALAGGVILAIGWVSGRGIPTIQGIAALFFGGSSIITSMTGTIFAAKFERKDTSLSPWDRRMLRSMYMIMMPLWPLLVIFVPWMWTALLFLLMTAMVALRLRLFRQRSAH